MKKMATALAAAMMLGLTACGADQATINRNTLGTSQSIHVAAQKVALDYRARPPCTAVSTTPCRNNITYAAMQRMDRVATETNNAAFESVKADPGATSTKLAVDAAIAAIRSFDVYTKEQK